MNGNNIIHKTTRGDGAEKRAVIGKATAEEENADQWRTT
jgi:hypothetical protein